MAERVVISRSRKADVVETREFNFTPDLVRGLGEDSLSPAIRDYRIRAWESYHETPMPTTTDEPWRRTDLHGLRAGAFRLPSQVDLAALRLPSRRRRCCSHWQVRRMADKLC